jgi:hypothetical protein
VLPGPALSAVIGAQQARRAQHNAQFFKALGEGAANSQNDRSGCRRPRRR